MTCYQDNIYRKQVITTEIIVFAKYPARNRGIAGILINLGFHGNERNISLALYLKMLVLVSSNGVPNFMLVSKSEQFGRNFEPYRRTIPIIVHLVLKQEQMYIFHDLIFSWIACREKRGQCIYL